MASVVGYGERDCIEVAAVERLFDPAVQRGACGVSGVSGVAASG